MEIEDLENYSKELFEDLEMNKQFAEDDELEINCIEEIMNALFNKKVTIPFTKRELRTFLTKTRLFQKLLKNAFYEENQKLKDENNRLVEKNTALTRKVMSLYRGEGIISIEKLHFDIKILHQKLKEYKLKNKSLNRELKAYQTNLINLINKYSKR